MSIPTKLTIVAILEEYFRIKILPVKGTRIIYEGILSNKKKLILCTPKSKLYDRGYDWIDVTKKQVSRFTGFDYCILVLRIEGGNVFYMHFSSLQKYLTAQSMFYNKQEGEHWKLHIWPDKIAVVGNPNAFAIEPNNFNDL